MASEFSEFELVTPEDMADIIKMLNDEAIVKELGLERVERLKRLAGSIEVLVTTYGPLPLGVAKECACPRRNDR